MGAAIFVRYSKRSDFSFGFVQQRSLRTVVGLFKILGNLTNFRRRPKRANGGHMDIQYLKL